MPVLLPLMVQISRSDVIIVGICQRQDFSSGVLVGDKLVGWPLLNVVFLLIVFLDSLFLGLLCDWVCWVFFFVGKKFIYFITFVYIHAVVGHRLVR